MVVVVGVGAVAIPAASTGDTGVINIIIRAKADVAAAEVIWGGTALMGVEEEDVTACSSDCDSGTAAKRAIGVLMVVVVVVVDCVLIVIWDGVNADVVPMTAKTQRDENFIVKK